MVTIRDLIEQRRKVIEGLVHKSQEVQPQTQLCMDCAVFLIEKYGTNDADDPESIPSQIENIKIPIHYFTPREFSRELMVFSCSYITELLRQNGVLKEASVYKGKRWYFDAVMLLNYVKDCGLKEFIRNKAKRFLANAYDMQKLNDLIKKKTS